MIIIGNIFDVSIFKSYPSTDRWGYSGFLKMTYSVIFSSIILIYTLNKKEKLGLNSYLLIFALILSGTKASILSISLIFFIVIIKSVQFRAVILFLLLPIIFYVKDWLPILISKSFFWKNVYEKHGLFGVITSLRNENFMVFKKKFSEGYDYWAWFFGGRLRIENLYVEIGIVDVFLFFGVVGSIVLCNFYLRITPNWKFSIPLIVGGLSGYLIIAPLASLIWMIWCEKQNQEYDSMS